jgi:tripartite-type tricarboxylate transporter receptor subunit TctC
MMMTRRIITKLAIATAGLVLAFGAAAQSSYPARTIRLVVGFAAGGPTDIPARMIADRLGTALGQRIVVENKTGAGGMLGTRDVLAQEPDGYTLLLCTHFDSINVVAYRNPGFKLSDLAPISLVSKYYYALAMAPSVPAHTFEEFVAYAKAHPGELSYATIGSGSAQEIMARQLEVLSGIKMNKVPFRNGTQVVTDMIAGRVQVYFAPTLAVLPYHPTKQLKILAVSSPERLANAPDIPALKEKGLEFVRFGWLGICARSGTPQPVVDKLNKAIAAVVATPDYRSLIEKGGSIPASSTPAELGQILNKTMEDVGSTIREFGMQQD